MDPRDFRRISEIMKDLDHAHHVADIAAEVERHNELSRKAQEPLAHRLLSHQNMWRSIQNALQTHAEHNRTLQDIISPDKHRSLADVDRALLNIPPTDVQRSLTDAVEALNSQRIQSHIDEIRYASELVENRFGQTGWPTTPPVSIPPAQWNQGVQDAEARIRSGHAGNVLSEATELASDPEIQEAIEEIDETKLQGLIQHSEQTAGTDGTEVETEEDLEIDAEIEAQLADLDNEQLSALYFFTLKVWNILYAALIAESINPKPRVSPERITPHLSGVAILMRSIVKIIQK